VDDLANLDDANVVVTHRNSHVSSRRTCDPATLRGGVGRTTWRPHLSPVRASGPGIRRWETDPGQDRQAITPGDLENQARLTNAT
jgi:hypothetical protein